MGSGQEVYQDRLQLTETLRRQEQHQSLQVLQTDLRVTQTPEFRQDQLVEVDFGEP